jgi:hypothetical protein
MDKTRIKKKGKMNEDKKIKKRKDNKILRKNKKG